MGFIGELTDMAGRLVRGEYFDFVTKNRMGGEIPVFTYHRTDRETFEKHLDHLKKNDYQTLNSVQLYEAMQSSKVSEKTIMLTFDDGLEDLYSVAFPLLRSYGLQAIAFIAPYWVGSDGVTDWPQIEEMHRSGAVDFQAHSYTHGRIPVSPKIVDFFHPRYSYHQVWEVVRIGKGGEEKNHRLPEWGAPLYLSESCLSGKKRYYDDDDLAGQCIDYVKIHGGVSFFKKLRWRQKLWYIVRVYQGKNKREDLHETDDQQVARIRREIELPKSIIEAKLPDKKVLAFAYPYYEHGEIADKILEECGYRLVFGGLNRNTHFESAEPACFYLRRITGDFVMRLPGNGRSSLLGILSSKMRRRLKKVSVY